MADLSRPEQAVYDAIMRTADVGVADRLTGFYGEDLARAIVHDARGPILAEAAEALAELVARSNAAKAAEVKEYRW
jgi:hypothetical protein